MAAIMKLRIFKAARLSKEDAERFLDDAIARKSIRSVIYGDVKNAIDKFVRVALETEAMGNLAKTLRAEEDRLYESWLKSLPSDPREEHPVDWRGLNDQFRKSIFYKDTKSELLYSIKVANLKVLLGYCNTAAKRLPKEPRWDIVRLILSDLQPLLQKLETAKAYIVKGRQPSENPNAVPARTLEKTGTCGICNRNVKLAGKLGTYTIWTHGYQIETYFGSRTQDCFGAGYPPIEVSSKSLEAYKKHLEVYQESLPERVRDLQSWITDNPRSPENKKMFANKQRMLEHYQYDQRTVPTSISNLADKIAAWQPRQLPGA